MNPPQRFLLLVMLLPDQKKSERISAFILIMTTSDAPYTYANLPVLLQKMAEMTVRNPSAKAIYTQSMLGEGEAGVGDGDPAFFDQITLDEALQIYSLV